MTTATSTAAELWVEARSRSNNEVLGGMIRDELNKENVTRVDLSYIGNEINQWWESRPSGKTSELIHSELKVLVLEILQPAHLESILNFGSTKTHTAALFLEHTFNIQNKNLARLVHEVMADIAGLVDVKYPYEDHKELFPKTNDTLASDWGRGLGIIRPHSDDLYEDRVVNAMCLTVCRDISRTPTWFWLLKDIVACLTDAELGEFVLSEAVYLSGTNVEGKTIEVTKPVLRRDPIEGIGLRIDFRIDDVVGARMRLTNKRTQKIFEKMRTALKNLRPICSSPTTGSISLLSNYKILHGRSALNPVMLYEGESSRILFRSKGTK